MRFVPSIVSIALLSLLPLISSLPMNNLQPVQESFTYKVGNLLNRGGDDHPYIVVSTIAGEYYVLPLFGTHEANTMPGKDWKDNSGKKLYFALSALPYDRLKRQGPYTILSHFILQCKYEEKLHHKVDQMPSGAMIELLHYLKANVLPYMDTSHDVVILTKSAQQGHLDSMNKYIDTHGVGSSVSGAGLTYSTDVAKLKIGSVIEGKFPKGRRPGPFEPNSRPVVVVMPPNDNGMYLGLPLFQSSGSSFYKGENTLSLQNIEDNVLYNELRRITADFDMGKLYTSLGNTVYMIPNDEQPIMGTVVREAMVMLLQRIKGKWEEEKKKEEEEGKTPDKPVYPIVDLHNNVLSVKAKDAFLNFVDAYIGNPSGSGSTSAPQAPNTRTISPHSSSGVQRSQRSGTSRPRPY